MASSSDSIYFYDPSLAASILFTILYMLPFLQHVYTTIVAPQTGKYKSTRWMTASFIPILIGAGIEVAGYAVRCASVENPADVGLYATSSTLIVIAPIFVCASVYLLVGRLIAGFSGAGSKVLGTKGIPVAWLPRILVASDVLSMLTQGAGSGIASAGDWEGSEKDAGIGVLIGGLVLQLVTFSVFLVIVVAFHVGARRGGEGKKKMDRGVKMILLGVYIAGFFIMVRSIYRVIEFALGIDAYTFTKEWPLYVLEAVPMLIAMLVLGWFHPGRWLQSADGYSSEESPMTNVRKSHQRV